MTVKKNILSYSFLDFVSSNFENVFDTIGLSASEAEDEAAFSGCSYEDFGIVLSGAKTNTVGASQGHAQNQPRIVDLGDGIPRYAVKVRVDNSITNPGAPGATDMFPSPFDPDIAENHRQWLISKHPWAYTLLPATEGLSFNYGDTVTIIRQRGKMFITRNHSHKFAIPFGGGVFGTGDLLNWNPNSLMGDAPLITIPGGAGEIMFTVDDYKMINKSGCLEPLMSYIGKHEGGKGGYNGYNSCYGKHTGGKGGRGGGSSQDASVRKLIEAWGKPFTQMTIQEVWNTQVEPRSVNYITKSSKDGWRSPSNGCRVFALGKYQLIPGTFQSATTRIAGLNKNDIFDEEMQEVFGTYLAIWKRWKQLGKFLFGQHRDIVKAQLGVAQEWASMPVAKATTRDGKVVPAGYGYYAGVGINSAKPKLDRMYEVTRLLKKARECFLATKGTSNDLIQLAIDRKNKDTAAANARKAAKKAAKKSKK